MANFLIFHHFDQIDQKSSCVNFSVNIANQYGKLVISSG